MYDHRYSELKAEGVNLVLLQASARKAVVFHHAEESLEHSILVMIDRAKPFEAAELNRLFQLVTAFHGILKSYDRMKDSRKAVHEFIRQMITGEINTPATKDNPLTLIDAIRFVKTVQNFKKDSYDLLFNVVEGRSDDGYGDFRDSLILAGESVYVKVLCGAYCKGDWKRLQDDIKEAVGDEIANFIINGENYIAMFTRNKIQEFMYSWVRNIMS